MTFVGSQAGRAARAAPEDKFTLRVITPDKDALASRQAMRQALATALADRAKFWEAELAAWTAEFEEADLKGLRDWLGEDSR